MLASGNPTSVIWSFEKNMCRKWSSENNRGAQNFISYLTSVLGPYYLQMHYQRLCWNTKYMMMPVEVLYTDGKLVHEQKNKWFSQDCLFFLSLLITFVN